MGAARVRTRTGASIVAVVRGGQVYASPAPDFVLAAGDLVVVVDGAEGVNAVADILARGQAAGAPHGSAVPGIRCDHPRSGFARRVGVAGGYLADPLYLIAGPAFGTGGILPLATSEEFVAAGAEIGVVLLLLTLGLAYNADELAASLRGNARAGLGDLVVNAAPGAILALLLGWGPVAADDLSLRGGWRVGGQVAVQSPSTPAGSNSSRRPRRSAAALTCRLRACPALVGAGVAVPQDHGGAVTGVRSVDVQA
ncbi:TrkA family protein [Nonomuraea polychroma]|uniref:TrkA family protein n=2 Tax=Nonomuraea polychroma TaxID=46176 RepID=A0A438M6P5_9ACTN|nr:TrkA family protein [Nonomuraea polychroma]